MRYFIPCSLYENKCFVGLFFLLAIAIGHSLLHQHQINIDAVYHTLIILFLPCLLLFHESIMLLHVFYPFSEKIKLFHFPVATFKTKHMYDDHDVLHKIL